MEDLKYICVWVGGVFVGGDGTQKAYFWNYEIAKNVSHFNFNILKVY